MTSGNPPYAVFLDHADIRPRIPHLKLQGLLDGSPSSPLSLFRSLLPQDPIAARLSYNRLENALSAYLYFWRRRLADPCLPSPRFLVSRTPFPEVVTSRTRELFASHAHSFLDCDAVKSVEKACEGLSIQIYGVDKLLADKNRVKVFLELGEKRRVLLEERKLLVDKLSEFRAAVNLVIAWIQQAGEHGKSSPGVDIFDFGNGMDWKRVQFLLLRECRRLEDGLPIYCCRRRILEELHSNQVIVLIGETGSGKSSQLVQFLADSGLAGNGTILCTQPRKIAARSIADRVEVECNGCYPNKFITFCPTYSSFQNFDSKIIFLTDNCLLQHCMNDLSFAGISYIIVDEAHERSLNTDLLLALIKKQLLSRPDLRLIIMSATADACKLSDYFYGCRSFYVKGRTFPVDIKYIPDVSGELSWATITRKISGNLSDYVMDVVKMVAVVHQIEETGDILAFLTAQVEVEWACEHFQSPSAIVLPLHGKLSCEEQSRIFQKYPGKRKIIFCTNLAETSLTIPGIKYVVDSGMVKESRFESSSGMNVLKVCPVSQSSARQRSGRAGRTEPGTCFRLYSEADFDAMSIHQEPEIRKVHLGIAILKIITLGISNLKEFEFIDAPSVDAIDVAVRNLVHLGAATYDAEALRPTNMGRQIVKLGIEPRLGKLILDGFESCLVREAIVLAALMANSSSIFCRVGSDEDKAKADCLKVPFCHQEGDLFTLLCVYKEWENGQDQNKWCWKNSINAKTMRRCRDAVEELEISLKFQLNKIVPSYWKWNPNEPRLDRLLKNIILHCLPENVAMFSGCERLGYEVVLTGEHVQLHPSCSLLTFGNRPDWVVFSDILSTSKQYLVCVSAVDRDSLCAVDPPLFDVSKVEDRRVERAVIGGTSTQVLRRLCGKGNIYLHSLTSQVQMACKNCKVEINVDFENRAVNVFASLKDIEVASSLVKTALDCEAKWLRDECIEKSLFHGVQNTTVALFGRGAEIRHFEVKQRYLTVEISHASTKVIDDKQLLTLIDQSAPGIAGFRKYDIGGSDKWGRITFLKPESAAVAVQKLNGLEFCGSPLKVFFVCPKVFSVRSLDRDHKLFPYHAVSAKVSWPRKISKGVAFVRCNYGDADLIVQDCANLFIGNVPAKCQVSTKFVNTVMVCGINIEATETEIYNAIRSATKRRVFDVQLLRGDAIYCSIKACKEALLREIQPFLSDEKSSNCICRVEVFEPDPKDTMMRAMITFDGSLHLEAAKALDHLQGKSLPNCLPWQRINCQRVFRSSISCHPHVYNVIRKDLDSVLHSLRHCEGASCELNVNENGCCHVKIVANGTKKIADMRRLLEPLMAGKAITNTSLTSVVRELLSTKEGHELMISVGRKTGTYILNDKQKNILKIFGCENKVAAAEELLVSSLLTVHKKKQLEIPLLSSKLPPNLMQEVIKRFGSDLRGLKEKVPGADFLIKSTRFQVLSVQGDLDQKEEAQKLIFEVAESLGHDSQITQPLETTCPICLCELEEPYRLGACGHAFCRSCLMEQCESVIRSREGFPLSCVWKGCNTPFLVVDLRSLLSNEKMEELFRASLVAFVAASEGAYRFCPSPDCTSIYKVADAEGPMEPFVCGACCAETCTRCHLEYHSFVSCDQYKKFKEHPDLSLMEWRKGKENVKNCPVCSYTIEKIDGCDHIACKCGKHICWVCLAIFETSEVCYAHIRREHIIAY